MPRHCPHVAPQRVIDFYGAKPEGKLTLLLDEPATKGAARRYGAATVDPT